MRKPRLFRVVEVKHRAVLEHELEGAYADGYELEGQLCVTHGADENGAYTLYAALLSRPGRGPGGRGMSSTPSAPTSAEARVLDALVALREAAEEFGDEALADATCSLSALWAAGLGDVASGRLVPLVRDLLALGSPAPAPGTHCAAPLTDHPDLGALLAVDREAARSAVASLLALREAASTYFLHPMLATEVALRAAVDRTFEVGAGEAGGPALTDAYLDRVDPRSRPAWRGLRLLAEHLGVPADLSPDELVGIVVDRLPGPLRIESEAVGPVGSLRRFWARLLRRGRL